MTSRKLKPQRLWAVTYVSCHEAMPWTVRRTRLQAIKACLGRDDWSDEPWREEWASWKKLGCKTVRVQLITEPPK